MLLTGLITPTLFYYSCLNCKAQLPIIQFRFFKIKNSILMIQFFFILFSLSMISPCLATEMSSSEDMSLRSEEHTSELQSQAYLVCRLLLEKKKHKNIILPPPSVRES